MSVCSRWIIECNADGCGNTLGNFLTEYEAIEYAKYGEHEWSTSEKEWMFGVQIITYCPTHSLPFNTDDLAVYSSRVIRLFGDK